MDIERLQKQIDFIVEIDKLKHIFRQTLLMDKSRNENSAEHSWHIAVMAILLKEYAADDIQLEKVLKLVLIHDLIEIYAGDTFCYDDEANKDKKDREAKAAEKLFNILPGEQADEFRALWDEFEACETPESRFAAALDRLQPLIHNFYTDGHTWQLGNVTREQVLQRNEKTRLGSPALYGYVKKIIDQSVEMGILNP